MRRSLSCYNNAEMEVDEIDSQVGAVMVAKEIDSQNCGQDVLKTPKT